MSTIRSICVYCASGPGNNPAFMQAAVQFGRILGENGIRLVYGGGSVGLMGALAEAVLDHGGMVTGVIPDFLVNREHMLVRVQERVITRDMHERKRVMFERADAFEDERLPWLNLDVSYLGLRDHANDRDYHTFGVRGLRAPKAGQVDYELELIGQVGERGDLDHSACAGHAELGYTLALPWTPRLVVQLDYASGTADPDDVDD